MRSDFKNVEIKKEKKKKREREEYFVCLYLIGSYNGIQPH